MKISAFISAAGWPSIEFESTKDFFRLHDKSKNITYDEGYNLEHLYKELIKNKISIIAFDRIYKLRFHREIVDETIYVKEARILWRVLFRNGWRTTGLL